MTTTDLARAAYCSYLEGTSRTREESAAEFDRWLADHDAQVLRDAATEIGEHYPPDVWPRPTDEQMRQIHEFARSIGLPDGSRFHVHGIRHAITLLRETASRIEKEGRDAP
ncbi:MAG: hypothetical protein K0Q46_6472 [Rhodococcus erythropolis]|jgi:hypothetical protein|nr:hypothetical protein [Rhodococcus erythropolis]MDF2899686.1 hypothetical protein [Rhodococcus erythropolis]